MDKKIREWIRKNVKSPKDHCFFHAAILALLYDMKLKVGPPTKEMAGGRSHFWAEKNGKIYDPTVGVPKGWSHYPQSFYKIGKEVSVFNNMEFVLIDPLFKTLTKKTQADVWLKLAKMEFFK
jgi:hypothetical protein